MLEKLSEFFYISSSRSLNGEKYPTSAVRYTDKRIRDCVEKVSAIPSSTPYNRPEAHERVQDSII